MATAITIGRYTFDDKKHEKEPSDLVDNLVYSISEDSVDQYRLESVNQIIEEIETGISPTDNQFHWCHAGQTGAPLPCSRRRGTSVGGSGQHSLQHDHS